MDQANSVVMSMLQSMAVQTAGVPKQGKSEDGETSDFQKLLDEKSQEKDPLVEDRPKDEAPAAKKTDKAPAQKKAQQDPTEDSKAMNVYLVPVPQEVLEQYPAEWLPGNLQEGEPVVCIGVRTDASGQQVPILVGANEAAKMYGKEVVAPEVIDVSDPEADAILEATAPGADNSPAALLEKVVNDEAGQVVRQAAEEAQPQQKDDEQVEIIDVEQSPQQVFHDVKAAPVKVGEVETPRQADEADVVKQVEDQIAQAIQRGESTVTVKLNPERLGEVTVQVSMKDGGVLAVAISARDDDTRALLERHSGNLQELLSSRVHETVEVDVQRQSESQQSQNQQQNYDGHNGHAQDGQQRRRQREHTNTQDFMQQLRLGLIPADGEF